MFTASQDYNPVPKLQTYHEASWVHTGKCVIVVPEKEKKTITPFQLWKEANNRSRLVDSKG